MTNDNIVRAWKLVKLRKDGTLGPLFINRRLRLHFNKWLEAEDVPTKGYAHRPGWHCCLKPCTPHLSKEGRVWLLVEVADFTLFERPENQGGTWLIANRMKVLKRINNAHEMSDDEIAKLTEKETKS